MIVENESTSSSNASIAKDDDPKTTWEVFGIFQNGAPKTKSQKRALCHLFQAIGLLITTFYFKVSLCIGLLLLFCPSPFQRRKYYYLGLFYALFLRIVLSMAHFMHSSKPLFEYTKTAEFKAGFTEVAIEIAKAYAKGVEQHKRFF